MTSIWAHRGASAYAPENTLAAFNLAIEQGAHGVELDVQRSRDGQLVVIHDETINRTSTGKGRVADLTFQELRSYDFSNSKSGFNGTPIPTLEEVLELLMPTGLVCNIELKNQLGPDTQLTEQLESYVGLAAQVEAVVVASGMAQRVWISSFNHRSLRALSDFGSDVPRGALFSEHLVDPWIYAKDLGVQAIHPQYLNLTKPDVVEGYHQAGLAVHAWTVPMSKVRELAQLGVDALIVNEPDLALKQLTFG